MSTQDRPPEHPDEFGQDGFRHDLRSLLIQMAPPYGFTLATFTAAGVTTYEHGAPHPLEILLFLIGAFIGYAVLAVVSGALRRMLTPQGITMQGWQMLHLIPLAVVFLVCWGLASIVPDPLCWLTSGMALTIGYLTVLTFELSFLMHSRMVRS